MTDNSPISIDDIQSKLTELKDDLESAAGAARGTINKVGVIAGIVFLVLAFVLGSRRGKAGKTVVEVRRL